MARSTNKNVNYLSKGHRSQLDLAPIAKSGII